MYHPHLVGSILFLMATLTPTTGLRAQDVDAAIARDIREAHRLAEDGRFADAAELLRPHAADVDGPVVSPAATELEVLRRIQHDYSLSADRILDKVRAIIPDATADDVRRWTESDLLQHRVIDGKTCYFRREPSNLVRFCPEARERWLAHADPKTTRLPGTKRFPLVDHVANLVELSEKSASPEIYPVRTRITYTLTVPADHPRLKPGAKVRCWLPFPQDYRQQKAPTLSHTEPNDVIVAPNGSPQRTVYLERTVESEGQEVTFEASFEYVVNAFYPHLDPAKVEPYDRSSDLYQEYTAERPPHIVKSKRIKRLAREIVGDETNPLKMARLFFLWICNNIDYCSEVEYSTIPNIGAKGIETRKGDCGVQAMAFITLCRTAGLPARWQSGWTTLPQDWNMHDWAEVYIAPWGWLPVDPSYGLMDHEDPRVREFYFGHIDPYRLIVNLDFGRDLQPKKTSFRSEPTDFQRGEVEIDGHNLYFDEWDWDYQVETLPLDAEQATSPSGGS